MTGPLHLLFRPLGGLLNVARRLAAPRHPERNTSMAQKTTVVLVDDLDGGSADETVSFSLDGVEYEIDLSADNAAALRDTLGVYVGSARRVGGRAKPRSRAARQAATSGGSAPDSASVRAWAREEGLQVSDRGRVPADILRRYEAAHS